MVLSASVSGGRNRAPVDDSESTPASHMNFPLSGNDAVNDSAAAPSGRPNSWTIITLLKAAILPRWVAGNDDMRRPDGFM